MRTLSKFFVFLLTSSLFGCGYLSAYHLVSVTDSMAPTIEIGDHMGLVGVKSNDIDPIARFDIVGYHRRPEPKRGIDEKTVFVHRIVGLPGETIELRKGIVLVNGNELDQKSFELVEASENRKPILVPPDEYFVLGDNRPNSEDSRYIGTIKRSDIEGKVTNIIRKTDYENGKRW